MRGIYDIHRCHERLFIYGPVVIIGHSIHGLCHTQQHHTAAVGFCKGSSKVVLFREEKKIEKIAGFSKLDNKDSIKNL